MMEKVITFILLAVAIYLVLGLLFSLFFLRKGLTKVDASTEGTNWIFKLLILPGLLVFWPLFFYKWNKTK